MNFDTVTVVHWAFIIWVVTVPLHPPNIYRWSKYTIPLLYIVWFLFSGKCPLSIADKNKEVANSGFIYNQFKGWLQPYVPQWFWDYLSTGRFTALIQFTMACVTFFVGLRDCRSKV